jgi:hypothetical protein
MAKVTFGPLISEARNKQGNLVFSRNTHGAYTRAWFEPDQTLTGPRQYIQDIFRPVCKYWSASLTEAQRTAWAAFAAAHPFKYRHGPPRPGFGYSAFLRLNLALKFQGYAYMPDPPPNTHVLTPTSLSVDAHTSANHMYLTWTPTPIPANHDLLWWASDDASPGINFFGHLMRWTSGRWANEASPQDMYADYVAVWGAPAAGKAIGHRIYFLNRNNGVFSASLFTKSITY